VKHFCNARNNIPYI
jgi:hypothetical protein